MKQVTFPISAKAVAEVVAERDAEIERLRARLQRIEAQAIATTEPDMVAVPAVLVYGVDEQEFRTDAKKS